jgi:hypothetical protein
MVGAGREASSSSAAAAAAAAAAAVGSAATHPSSVTASAALLSCKLQPTPPSNPFGFRQRSGLVLKSCNNVCKDQGVHCWCCSRYVYCVCSMHVLLCSCPYSPIAVFQSSRWTAASAGPLQPNNSNFSLAGALHWAERGNQEIVFFLIEKNAYCGYESHRHGGPVPHSVTPNQNLAGEAIFY